MNPTEGGVRASGFEALHGPLRKPLENRGGVKIDIYAPRKVADLVVVHDLAISKMHSRCFL